MNLSRFLIQMEYSWVSLDESEEERAWELYREQGKRLFKTKDIFDKEGILLAGPPEFVDLSLLKEKDDGEKDSGFQKFSTSSKLN